MTLYGDEGVLRHELEYAGHNLMSATLEGRYRLDSAIAVLQEAINSIPANVGSMDATPANIASMDGAIPDVRSELDAAISYVYQAVDRLNRAM